MSAPARPDRQRNAIATSKARPPMRAILAASAPAMPTTTSDTTSGMTVMRIALTNNVPNGSMYITMRSIVATLARLSNRPNAKPAMSAMRTRVLSDGGDTRQSYPGRDIEQDKNAKRASMADALLIVQSANQRLEPLDPLDPLEPLDSLDPLDPFMPPLEPDEPLLLRSLD